MSYSLRPQKPQHTKPPCPSPTPGVHPNPCPLSRWCHPTISSFVTPFSSCRQSFPASGSFQMSKLFASVGQSIKVSASTSDLPMNTQDWSPLGWTGWISLQSNCKKSLLQHHSSKASILQCSAFFIVQLSHPYMNAGKTIALIRQTFVDKVISLLFNILSRLVITFLPKSKHLLISWLKSPSSVILEPRKIKSATVSTVSPSICHEVMGLDAMILVFWMLSFKPNFHFPLLLSSRGSLVLFFFILFFNFTILYWFCHISTWIHHRYTCVPHPEPSSLLPPHTIPLGHPSAPAPSIQYHGIETLYNIIYETSHQSRFDAL